MNLIPHLISQQELYAQLSELYVEWSGENPDIIQTLPPSGSNRIYVRLKSGTKSAIGVWNQDEKENNAFVYLSKHFRSKDIGVPEVYIYKPEKFSYLQQDLGETSLYDGIIGIRSGNSKPDALIFRIYRSVLEQLIRIQVEGTQELDYSKTYPRASFDRQSAQWDLNYFKYNFLKLASIQFDEQLLENDFDTFLDWFDKAPGDFFLYRDFQSRNIMMHESKPYFIDFQGGRKGALQYDIASLLYDAKADLNSELRNQLLEYYISLVTGYTGISREDFLAYYPLFVLLRIMQNFGAYGYRGLYEQKEHFIKSIAFAQKNLYEVLKRHPLPDTMPELARILSEIALSEELAEISQAKKTLTVHISSFSYRRGIPDDTTGHGGGFVFDCRFLPNPGRLEAYKQFTGCDPEIAYFFSKQHEAFVFQRMLYPLIDRVIETYQEKEHEHLTVNFGCTGGQHRSVYFAQALANYLTEKYKVKIDIKHRELEMAKQWMGKRE